MAATTETPADAQTEATTAVTVSREIAAPVGVVFRHFIEPASMMRWFGVNGFTNLDCAVDARADGAWHMESRTPDGSLSRMEGVIKAIDPDARLVQSWCHVDGDGVRGNETEAEIVFEATATGTRVTVHHRNIRFTPEAFQGGWTQSLERLVEMCA